MSDRHRRETVTAQPATVADGSPRQRPRALGSKLARLRYWFTAGALGAGWFVILQLPRTTREWLLADVLQNLAFLILASIIVAVTCRRFIDSADTLGAHAVRATVLPYVGCLVFLSLWAARLWIRHLWYGGLANLHDTVSLYVMGLTATTTSSIVVIPYGLLCQYVMSRASRHGTHE